MPFGNKAGPTLVYSYYARAPRVGPDITLEQMLLAHRYRNALVELELRRRARYAEILAAAAPEIPALEARVAEIDGRIETLRADVKARNAAARRKRGTAEDRAAITALRAERREVWTEIRERKLALRESGVVDAAVDAMQAEILVEHKRLRATCGVYWATYLQIEQSIPRSGPPPRFQRWEGEGKVAVQIQCGMTWAEVLGCADTKLRVQWPTGDPISKREARRGHRCIVSLRIGSDDRGGPVWAEIPVQVHREPPDDSRIKWAWLTRRRAHGTEWRWSLQLVLERAEGWGAQDCATTGAVGVDIGWRLLDDRLRVAYWYGDDGASGELALPPDLVKRWSYAKSIQSHRSIEFDGARDSLTAWLAAHRSEYPDWLAESSTSLAQWRSEDRLARLVQRWSSERFQGDETIYEILQEWRSDDRHHLHIQASVREQVISERREIYRRFAAMLRRRYALVCVEKWNIRETFARPAPEEERADAQAKLYHRTGAPGLLREILTGKAREVARVPAALTTQTCAECRREDRFDAREQLVWRCATCGHREDQDLRAARNLLRIGREQSDIGGSSVDTRDPSAAGDCGMVNIGAGAS